MGLMELWLDCSVGMPLTRRVSPARLRILMESKCFVGMVLERVAPILDILRMEVFCGIILVWVRLGPCCKTCHRDGVRP